jgi:hypothetical protein
MEGDIAFRSHGAHLLLHTSILKRVIPAGIAGIHDCKDAEGRAMHGAVAEKPWMAIPKQTASITRELLSKIKRSHPCALDSGNPCRNDGVLQALVYKDERNA